MIFQGSKAKYAESIVPKLQRIIDENDIKCYIEPFVGGANVIDKIHCEVKIGYDKNAPLIALHQRRRKILKVFLLMVQVNYGIAPKIFIVRRKVTQERLMKILMHQNYGRLAQ